MTPWAILLAGLTAASLFASAVQREQQQILGELVGRHMHGQALAVASKVELTAFEHPEFHNRLQRVQAGLQQPLNMVYGVSGLISALVGVAGVSIALDCHRTAVDTTGADRAAAGLDGRLEEKLRLLALLLENDTVRSGTALRRGTARRAGRSQGGAGPSTWPTFCSSGGTGCMTTGSKNFARLHAASSCSRSSRPS